jgi:predicted site-specific integrase-resolvase
MYTLGELGRLLHVNAKTVTGWARGRIHAVLTPGGHRRFPLPVALAFLREMGSTNRPRKTR